MSRLTTFEVEAILRDLECYGIELSHEDPAISPAAGKAGAFRTALFSCLSRMEAADARDVARFAAGRNRRAA